MHHCNHGYSPAPKYRPSASEKLRTARAALADAQRERFSPVWAWWRAVDPLLASLNAPEPARPPDADLDEWSVWKVREAELRVAALRQAGARAMLDALDCSHPPEGDLDDLVKYLDRHRDSMWAEKRYHVLSRLGTFAGGWRRCDELLIRADKEAYGDALPDLPVLPSENPKLSVCARVRLFFCG
jgi:hypothetical protein